MEPLPTADRGTALPLLTISSLSVQFETPVGVVRAVDDASLTIAPGERVAVVGESGSGKSVMALAVLGLLEPPGRISNGSIVFDGVELTKLRERQLVKIRGRDISLVLQDPRAALDPLKSVGDQIAESLRLHTDLSRKEIRERTIDLLRQVRINDPEKRIHQYPHEMAGGMSQRVTIAAAIASNPRLLVADEPTSALDATTAAGILELLTELSVERDMAVMLITHDLSVVARFADRVVVLYASRVMETGNVDDIFRSSRHPYTRGLLESVPGIRGHRAVKAIPGTIPSPLELPTGCVFHTRCSLMQGRSQCIENVPALIPRGGRPNHASACHFADELAHVHTRVVASPGDQLVDADGGRSHERGEEILVVESLTKEFILQRHLLGGQGGRVRAVDDVSFSVRRGEIFAIVGESGSGKSTTARVVLGLEEPTSGTVRFAGDDLRALRGRRLKEARRQLQVVFQDPDGSLDPRMKVGDIISEPLRIHGVGNRRHRRERAVAMIERVGLQWEHADRYPRQFSGGQRQRIAIARSLALDPQLLICDEPVTALDVSVQAQILNLLQDIQSEERLAYLFIAHDLSVVRQIADRVAVMYLGQMVEVADATAFFERPHHPYSVALLSAVGVADPEQARRRDRIVLSGPLPSPFDPPPACRFVTRCWKAQPICGQVAPPLEEKSPGRLAACHFPEGLSSSETPAVSADRESLAP